MATEERKLLESWKEIAAYLNRSEKTCRRFEETLGLPVHRLDGTPRARVFAYADELDAWLKGKLNHAEEEAAEEAARVAAEEDRAEARVRKRKRIGLLVGAASLTVLAAAAAVLWRRFSPAPGPVLPRNPSLAVLPFDNPAKDPGLEAWRTALADLVITDLVQSRYVNVVRIMDLERKLAELKLREAESFTDEALKTFAEKAMVDYVATGSLVRRNGDILVSVQVRDPRKGIAAQPVRVGYGQEPEVFVAADRISKGIKLAVGLTSRHVSRDIDRDVSAVSTSSPQAFELFSRGCRLAAIGNLTKGVSLCQQALGLDTDFALAYRYLYRYCQALGREDEAKKYMQKAVDVSARLSERERGELEIPFYRDYAKDPNKQQDVLVRLNRIYPQDRVTSLSLVSLYIEAEEWDKALSVAEGAWPANKSDAVICRQLAKCHLNFGQGDRAVGILSEFIDANPGAPVVKTLKLLRAKCYLQMNRIDDALAEAERWLAQDPNDISGIIDAGLIHLRKENFPAARREFEKVLTRNEPWFQLDALLYLRDMFLMQGKVEEAKAVLRKGLEIAAGAGGERSRTLRPMKGGIHLELSYLHRLTGDLSEALNEIDAAEALGTAGVPLPVRLLADKAIVLLEMGRMEDFTKVAEEIKGQIEQGRKPKMMRIYYYLLGRREMAKGEPRQAAEYFWQAIDLLTVPGPNPDGAEPEYFYFLAEARRRIPSLGNPFLMYEMVLLPTIDHLHNGDLYAMSLCRLAQAYENRAQGSTLIRSSRADLEQAAEHYRKFLALWGEADPLFASQVEDARTRLAAIEKQLASQ